MGILLTIPFAFIFLSGLAIALQIGGDTKDSVILPGNITLCFYIRTTAFRVTRQGLYLSLKLMANALASVSALYMLTLSLQRKQISYIL